MQGLDQKHDVALRCESGVGKTSIMKVFTSGQMPTGVVSTLLAEYETKVTRISDGRTVKARVWDTAGQERYRSLTAAYFRRANGVIVVYDVTSQRSFEKVSEWIAMVRDTTADAAILLLGNKMDLVTPEKPVAVSQAEHDELCQVQGIACSARITACDSEQVANAFLSLLDYIMNSPNAPAKSTADGSVLSMAPREGSITHSGIDLSGQKGNNANAGLGGCAGGCM